MAYTGTLAQSGLGTTIAINTSSTTTPTWTVIGEVRKATQSNYQNETDDVTNFDSHTVGAREFIGTILNPGTWDLEINRVSSDAGQTAMVASLNAATRKQYQITLPKNASQTTAGDTKVFTAIVEKFGTNIEPTKAIMINCSLKVSGAVVETPGS